MLLINEGSKKGNNATNNRTDIIFSHQLQGAVSSVYILEKYGTEDSLRLLVGVRDSTI